MQVRVPDQAVCIDERLCHLILDNALSNAFKHGHCDNPDVQLAIELSQAATATSPDTMLLTATVTNVAHPARPTITPEFVTQVLEGG